MSSKCTRKVLEFNFRISERILSVRSSWFIKRSCCKMFLYCPESFLNFLMLSFSTTFSDCLQRETATKLAAMMVRTQKLSICKSDLLKAYCPPIYDFERNNYFCGYWLSSCYFQHELVTVAMLDCHDNQKICSKELGIEHGTYFFPPGKVEKKEGLVC